MFYMRFLYKKMSDSLVSDVSKSLWSLTKNERTGAIRSGRSVEMSNCEQIAHFWLDPDSIGYGSETLY